MKVAYLFDTFPSPTETFLAREVAALRAQGLAIDVWALRAGEGAQQMKSPSAFHRRFNGHIAWFSMGHSLGPKLRARGVRHIHAAWANYVADIAMGAAFGANLPWSFAAHARDLWVEGGDLRAKLDSARFATVCTRAGEARLREFGSNVFYMAHGIDASLYPWRDWQGETEMKLLGVGRAVAKKGWNDAARALRLLLEQNYRAHFTLIGDRAHRLDYAMPSEALTLRGALPHAEIIAAMQSANCLVLPSRVATDGDRDGLANVLLEAAAIGLPLVTTDAGSARDFVDDDTGWLCEPENPQALAATIARVWADPAETRRRCHNARERVEARFDAAKNVGALWDAFRLAG